MTCWFGYIEILRFNHKLREYPFQAVKKIFEMFHNYTVICNDLLFPARFEMAAIFCVFFAVNKRNIIRLSLTFTETFSLHLGLHLFGSVIKVRWPI